MRCSIQFSITSSRNADKSSSSSSPSLCASFVVGSVLFSLFSNFNVASSSVGKKSSEKTSFASTGRSSSNSE